MFINPKEVLDKGIVANLFDAKKQIQQVGIDLTIKYIRKLAVRGKVLKDSSSPAQTVDVYSQNGIYKLEKDSCYELTFYESCKIPEGMMATIHARSSVVRSGGIIKSGVYDSGYVSENIGAFLFTTLGMDVEVNSRLAQIVFFAGSNCSMYDGQFQGKK
jgi:deoxycytidine triphosphate deaminase